MRGRLAPIALAILACAGAMVAARPVASPAPQAARQAIGSWWDRTDPGRGRKLPTSRYYAIRSDLPGADTASYANHLDTMYEEYSRRLIQGIGLRRRSPEALNVLMFARKQDYLDTMRTQFGINAEGSGGMFFTAPRGSGLAFWVESLPRQRVEHVIQHEGFHQFASAFFGNELPPWLNEGLAEFFGESIVEGKAVVIGQASPQVVAQVRAAVESDRSLPFTDLLLMDDARWNANVRAGHAALQYQQSWSMVHFLVYGEDARHQGALQQLLRLINAGKKPFIALREALGLSTDAAVADFEQRWKSYAKAAKPGAYVAARGRLEFLAEGLAEVWSKGARPATLAELKDAMREARFTHVATSHGYVLSLSAADDANFAIPDDDVNGKPAAIELVPAKAKPSSPRRKADAAVPVPPAIRTRGLQPRDVAVAWRRRTDDPSRFDYDIAPQ